MSEQWWIQNGRVIDPSTDEDQIRDIFLSNGKIIDIPPDRSAFSRIDAQGCWVLPGLIDLHGEISNPRLDGQAAAAGGFTTVVCSARAEFDKPALVRDFCSNASNAPISIQTAVPWTIGLQGETITDVGRLIAAGGAVVSNGVTPIRNARILRNLLEYSRRFSVPLMLRGADPELDRGMMREGPRALWLGLPSIPPESEEIGISIIAALVRRTGTPVHLTHLWSRLGINALKRAQHEGLPITGGTTIAHLVLDDQIIERFDYSGFCRFIPPLGDRDDRAALREALLDGTLSSIASDHHKVAVENQDREFELAEPGVPWFASTWALAVEALGDPKLAVRAMVTGPAKILGLSASLQTSANADLFIWDPKVPNKAIENPLLEDRILYGKLRTLFFHGSPSMT